MTDPDNMGGVHPDEQAIDLLMACMSIFITQNTCKLEAEKLEGYQRGLETGKLVLEIQTPPLTIACYVDDGLSPARHIFTITDDRTKWFAWAKDLARRTQ